MKSPLISIVYGGIAAIIIPILTANTFLYEQLQYHYASIEFHGQGYIEYVFWQFRTMIILLFITGGWFCGVINDYLVNRKYDRYRVKVDDILNWKMFIDELSNNDTPYKQRLWQFFDIKTQNTIIGSKSKEIIDKKSKKIITRGLNKALEQYSVFDTGELLNPGVRNEYQVFFNKLFMEMDERVIRKINRYQLEDNFTDLVSKTDSESG